MADKKRILLVDDDVNFLKITKKILEYEDYDVELCSLPEMVIKRDDIDLFDVIITDLAMPKIDGVKLLKYVMQSFPGSKVIILTGNGTIDTAVEAIKNGAYTYMEKPVAPNELLKKIKEALRHNDGKTTGSHNESGADCFVGASENVHEIRRLVEKIAKVDSSVLIQGGSGTGKEIIANMIHHKSTRSSGAFIKVNCAAIPDSLLESELFGFEKGAFTGAFRSKKGLMEMADAGTLFLDEIGDLSILAQTKILRAIQEKEIARVGGETTRKVDFRLVSATNQDLKEMAASGKFREDFYYRINVVTVHVMPLAERTADIPALIRYFSDMYAGKFNKERVVFDQDVLDVFQNYHWPGNVRELKNVMEHIYVFANGSEKIRMGDLPHELLCHDHADRESGGSDPAKTGKRYKDVKNKFEKDYLFKMLRKNNWNISVTAKEIGLSRRNLHEKINQLGLK
ncbi:MAG: sigma-54 dependent transcriptional regulator, partial [Clostridiales Family XIII bacterium]|nr:sigma-54 dependent transcriptional regulator [Clostridiales Family XIII bacterium]